MLVVNIATKEVKSTHGIKDGIQRITSMSTASYAQRISRPIGWWGMAVFVAGEAMVFGALLVTYFHLRIRNSPWPPHGVPEPKVAVLLNPLVYMSEGLRAALTPQFPHMNLVAIYGALIAYTGLLTWAGINGFQRRVLT